MACYSPAGVQLDEVLLVRHSYAVRGRQACLRRRSPGNSVPLILNLHRTPETAPAPQEVQLRRCLRDAAKLDHRMPSEVARLTAEEREVTPSFM